MDEAARARFREDALEQRRYATEWRSASTSAGARGSVNGPHGLSGAGISPAMDDISWSGAVACLIAEQTGAIASPKGGGYAYYRSGDFIGIHTDPYGCDLVLLTLLSGPVESLHCHLPLADTPLDEIQTLAEATNGAARGGTPFEISAVPFLLSGQRIPHHRAPQNRVPRPS